MRNPTPEFSLTYNRKTAAFGTDNDLKDAVNLYQTLYDKLMHTYPSIKITEKRTPLPNIAMISDSYGWTIVSNLEGNAHQDRLVNEIHFYYYFKSLWTLSTRQKKPFNRKAFDLERDIIKKHDALFIVTSEGSLFNIGFDFVDTALNDL